MSVTSGFFDSSGGDRKYNTEQMSSIFDGILKDGVYLSILNQFKVTPNVGMQITVDTGRAWFDHTWTLNDAKLNLNVEAAELVQNRIDAVVLEVNRSSAARKNTIKMVKGTPASSPQNPTLTKTEFVKQYPLAYIRVNKGVTSIGTADITIMVGKDECPFATSFLEAVSVTDLYEQWEADYSNWRGDQQEAFEEWFANAKDQLTEDPAGNLQNQIDEIMAGSKTPATGMSVCTHVRSGTIHKLTGTGTGNNIRFVATADFVSGDTFQVNGTTCTARTVAGDSLWASFFKSGSVVTCYRNGNTLTFNSGGLPSTEAAKLTPENLKSGVSVNINGKTVTGTFTSDGTADASSIAPGKVAYSKGNRYTGTFTSDANAVASAIRSGFSAYVNGKKISGDIPNKGAATITPKPYDQSISAGQYLTGNQIIKGDGNLAAQNIRQGVTIFGITGNFSDSPSGTIVWCGYGETRNEAGEDVAINGSILQGSPFFTTSGNNVVICSKKCSIYIAFNYWRYTQAGLTATLSIYRNGEQVASVYADSDQVRRFTSGAIGMNPGDRITMRTTGANASFRKDGCFAYIT